MSGLTHQQNKLLEFLMECAAKGDVPSYDEMKDRVGLRSKSGIIRLLRGLEARGAVKLTPRLARSVEIIRHECPECGAKL